MSVRRTLKALAADLNDIMRAARAREMTVVEADAQLAQMRTQLDGLVIPAEDATARDYHTSLRSAVELAVASVKRLSNRLRDEDLAEVHASVGDGAGGDSSSSPPPHGHLHHVDKAHLPSPATLAIPSAPVASRNSGSGPPAPAVSPRRASFVSSGVSTVRESLPSAPRHAGPLTASPPTSPSGGAAVASGGAPPVLVRQPTGISVVLRGPAGETRARSQSHSWDSSSAADAMERRERARPHVPTRVAPLSPRDSGPVLDASPSSPPSSLTGAAATAAPATPSTGSSTLLSPRAVSPRALSPRLSMEEFVKCTKCSATNKKEFVKCRMCGNLRK